MREIDNNISTSAIKISQPRSTHRHSQTTPSSGISDMSLPGRIGARYCRKFCIPGTMSIRLVNMKRKPVPCSVLPEAVALRVFLHTSLQSFAFSPSLFSLDPVTSFALPPKASSIITGIHHGQLNPIPRHARTGDGSFTCHRYAKLQTMAKHQLSCR